MIPRFPCVVVVGGKLLEHIFFPGTSLSPKVENRSMRNVTDSGPLTYLRSGVVRIFKKLENSSKIGLPPNDRERAWRSARKVSLHPAEDCGLVIPLHQIWGEQKPVSGE